MPRDESGTGWPFLAKSHVKASFLDLLFVKCFTPEDPTNPYSLPSTNSSGHGVLYEL